MRGDLGKLGLIGQDIPDSADQLDAVAAAIPDSPFKFGRGAVADVDL